MKKDEFKLSIIFLHYISNYFLIEYNKYIKTHIKLISGTQSIFFLNGNDLQLLNAQLKSVEQSNPTAHNNYVSLINV